MSFIDSSTASLITQLRQERDDAETLLRDASAARAATLRYARALQQSADPEMKAVGYRLEEIAGGGFEGFATDFGRKSSKVRRTR